MVTVPSQRSSSSDNTKFRGAATFGSARDERRRWLVERVEPTRSVPCEEIEKSKEGPCRRRRFLARVGVRVPSRDSYSLRLREPLVGGHGWDGISEGVTDGISLCPRRSIHHGSVLVWMIVGWWEDGSVADGFCCGGFFKYAQA
ncbi:hypothetical protein Dimus_036726 [Dionaea muscipula]